MILDVSIILAYFTVIMAIGVRARVGRDVQAEEYFLSARSLRWPSIAMSTIATNILSQLQEVFFLRLSSCLLSVSSLMHIYIYIYMKTSREVALRCRRHRTVLGAHRVQKVRLSSASRRVSQL